MLMQNMKVGQEIWFKAQQEEGRVYGQGKIQDIANDTVTLEGMEGVKGQYHVKPACCYPNEFEMKMGRYADDFEDKMHELSGKYIVHCKKTIEDLAGITINSPDAAKDVYAADMITFNDKFKNEVMQLAGHFAENTKKAGLEAIDKYDFSDVSAVDVMDNDDFDMVDVTLTDEDIQKIDRMTNSGINL